MAIRSGAGAGAIAAFIFRIVLSVSLLILCIVFYNRRVRALEALAAAEQQSIAPVGRYPSYRDMKAMVEAYDSSRTHKFLIHGKFDVDGDGRPSEAEADYLRRLVLDRGGEVYEGEGIPGDLDFVVMGEQPPLPPNLQADAPAYLMEINIRQRQARLEYDRLWEQASNAQIPVLNANRLLILIGPTDREADDFES